MNIEKARLKKLLTDYILNTISKPDLDELLDFISLNGYDSRLETFMQELLEDAEIDEKLFVDSEAIYQRIIGHPMFQNTAGPMKRHHPYWWLRIAAILLLGGLFLLYHLYVPQATTSEGYSSFTASAIDRTSGDQSKRAILRLADGSIIDLDSASSGLLATQGNMKITLKGTELHYDGGDTTDEGNATMNTIITPRGRQYQVVLPDGSKIWLNTATELRYPVRFHKEARIVEVVGEAYFEVEKARNWPFIVKTSTQEIKVLGTHFNVNAYGDDQTSKTTLVEGKVQVTLVPREANKGANIVQSLVLRPGEQAITSKENNRIKVEHIDTEEVISWKQNLFVFNNEEIKAVMKKVSRWYDIEVEYRDGMAGKRIGGTIPRFENIEKLMETLKATGLLDYKMEGGRIIIME